MPNGVCSARPRQRPRPRSRHGRRCRHRRRPPGARARSWPPRTRRGGLGNRGDGAGEGKDRRAGGERAEERAAIGHVQRRRVTDRCRIGRGRGLSAARTRSGVRGIAEAHARRIEHGVADRRRARHRGRFARASGGSLGAAHQDVDVRHVGETGGSDRRPIRARRRPSAREAHSLEDPAGRLDDVAVDLMADAVRIDHLSGVLAADDAGHGDLAGHAVDRDIRHPGRPGRRGAGELAVE